jgi:hypothetical protein
MGKIFRLGVYGLILKCNAPVRGIIRKSVYKDNILAYNWFVINKFNKFVNGDHGRATTSR